MDALPKNHAERVQKFELRAAGVTPDTWDREAHGYTAREIDAVRIAGAGALGSTFGGLLARAGHDVTLVDVDADHIDAVIRRMDSSCATPTVQSGRSRWTRRPIRDTTSARSTPSSCCARAGPTGEVAASIRHAVGPATWVATLQNGLGNDEALGDVLGPERVLPGTTTAGAHKPEPGVIDVSPITSSGSSVTQLGPPVAEPGDPGRRGPPDRRADRGRAAVRGAARCRRRSSGRSWPWPPPRVR